MKLNYFVLCWLATLFIGMIISTSALGNLEFGALFAGVSLLCSIPFIILFCLFMSGVIKKNPSKKQLHLTTLGFHFVLSIMTFAVFSILEFSEMSIYLGGIIFGYFCVDSLLFYLAIEAKYTSEIKLDDPELLDNSTWES